jgi:hypothetical protein
VAPLQGLFGRHPPLRRSCFDKIAELKQVFNSRYEIESSMPSPRLVLVNIFTSPSVIFFARGNLQASEPTRS